MGWFFKKRKTEVPLPPTEDLLDFPQKASSGKRIEPIRKKELPLPKPKDYTFPQKIKAAVRTSSDLPLPPELIERSLKKESIMVKHPAIGNKRNFFIRVHDYQEIIVNLEDIGSNSLEIEKANKRLDQSEFNENKSYENLKNNLKRIHDRLLLIDDIVFKK